MNIYPAIDLLDGCCVRLKQGSFDQSTVYSEDPIAALRQFEADGARFLHLVDLSGAKNPSQRQQKLIASIIGSTSMQVQVGGGLRTFGQAKEILESGADRVVIGSAAVSDPDLVLALLAEFGGSRITVALDIRIDPAGDPRIALHGWQEQSPIGVAGALAPFSSAGIERVLCTDISRDGMMTGPNIDLYSRLSAQFPRIEFQASGGISGLPDLLALKSAGIRSAIIGKAIYTGAVQLKEAIEQC